MNFVTRCFHTRFHDSRI